jgi:hypothetical protein
MLDQRGDSIVINFIGPLPKEHGYDSIMTITDRLGADICTLSTMQDEHEHSGSHQSVLRSLVLRKQTTFEHHLRPQQTIHK